MTEVADTPQDQPDLQMALVFRADLTVMTRAKSEVQAAHAGFDIAYKLMLSNPELVHAYQATNRKKASLEVRSLEELLFIRDKAEGRGVPVHVVEDAGLTIFGEPTVTCLILGPMSRTNSNALTRITDMRDVAQNKPA